MDFDTLMLSTRLCIHIATAAIIGFYVGNPQRTRYFVQLLAALLAGSSFALAMQVLTTWDELTLAGPQPWLVIFSGSFLFLVIHAGGNLAKLCDIFANFPPWRFWR